jgi:NitT/TauT family transport system ATP-binding protein
MTQVSEQQQLISPVSAEGLKQLAEKAKNNPSAIATVKAKTVLEGKFRNLNYVRDLPAHIIDEPPTLLGDDTAPNPSEAVLAALGSCLSVGIHANAISRGINLTKSYLSNLITLLILSTTGELHIGKIMNSQINFSLASGVNNLKTEPSILEIENLSKSYHSRHGVITVFEDINLKIKSQEIVCLLGASGCGKSSLLSAIAGLQKADQGVVYLNGEAIHNPHPHIGLMFQQASLLPWLTVRQNIELGLKLKNMSSLTASQIQQRVNHALSEVGLDHCHRTYPHQLSGGMAQRVAIARTIARSPQLLLMDEPFSALDAITRLEMQQLLLDVIHREKCTDLIVTHDIDEAILLGDRICLMSRHPGKIYRQWLVNTPQPRISHSHDLIELRSEIMETLAEVMAN